MEVCQSLDCIVNNANAVFNALWPIVALGVGFTMGFGIMQLWLKIFRSTLVDDNRPMWKPLTRTSSSAPTVKIMRDTRVIIDNLWPTPDSKACRWCGSRLKAGDDNCGQCGGPT